jgi:hypothetical protein
VLRRHEWQPVGAAQHLHYGGGDRGALAAGDAVELHGALDVEPLDIGAPQRLRCRGAARHDRDADIGLQQLDQVVFAGHVMAASGIDVARAQYGAQPPGIFAIAA